MDSVDKNLSNDRILKIEKIPGVHTLADDGSIANRMFAGDNELRAIMEPNGLWSLSYKSGVLPGPLKQQFTSYSTLKTFLLQYFYKRNLTVKEVNS